MKAKPIKTLLSEFLKGSNFEQINNTINLNKLWKKIVGKTIAQNTEIADFKQGKVLVKTSNPIWRNELIFQKEDLLKRLKKEDPKLNIKEIDFR